MDANVAASSPSLAVKSGVRYKEMLRRRGKQTRRKWLTGDCLPPVRNDGTEKPLCTQTVGMSPAGVAPRPQLLLPQHRCPGEINTHQMGFHGGEDTKHAVHPILRVE